MYSGLRRLTNHAHSSFQTLIMLLTHVIDTIGSLIGSFIRWFYHIETDKGGLKPHPDPIIWLSAAISLSTIIQAFTDYILETLSYLNTIFKIPFRLEFLFLTFISAVLGYFTLRGLARHELDVTQNSVFLSFVVEISLLTSDLHFLAYYPGLSMQVTLLRIPYMILTGINILFLIMISLRTRLFGFGSVHPYELN